MFFNRDHVRKGDEQYRKGNLQKAAEHYLKAKRFRQAARIYQELGQVERAVDVYDGQGLALEAAELLEAQGQHKEAISRFEKAGAFRKAAEACVEIRSFVRAGRLFENAEMFARAAECFLKAGEIEQGVRALEKESTRLRQQRIKDTGPSPAIDKTIREVDFQRAEILTSIGRNLEAARLLSEHGAVDRAAPLLERAGQYGEAARAYLEAGRFDEALKTVDRAPDANDELRAEIYLNCARHSEAARLFERMERFDAAASAYEGDEAWAEAAAMWEKAGSPGRAAEFYLQLERLEDAGRCFLEDRQPEKAASAFRSAGLEHQAGEAYQQAGKLLEAGEHFLKAGDGTAAREVLSAVPDTSPDYTEASLELIPLLVEDGSIDGAQHRLQILRQKKLPIPSAERLYVKGRIVEALGRFQQAEMLYQKVLAERHDFRDTAERLQDVRGKVTVTGPSEPRPSASGSQRRTRTTTRPEPRLAGPRTSTLSAAIPPQRATEAGDGSQDALSLPSLSESSELPFDIGEEIEAWWGGAAFFRATDRRSSEEILLVSFPLAEIGSRAESFRQAMREVAAVRHPAILKLHEAILASDKVLLLYERFSAETLGQRMVDGKFPPATALSLIVQLSEALTAAHKLGITHQWISPRTLLMDRRGRIKLVGLGLRGILDGGDDVSRAYLSPEVRGGGMVGPASDVYSLGLLAIELLQAQMPVDWSELEAVDAAAVSWPKKVEESVSGLIRETLIRALAREPLARPSTEELKAALSAVGLAPGQVLADRYEILGDLGSGGMSRVYRARDRVLEDEVAIKTLLTPAIGRSDDEERLLREVRICRRISHPNVVRVHDLGRFPGGIFVIMEILIGPGLDQVIEQEAPLELGRVKKLLSGIAAALAEAHHMKIIHRDLKPSNVILVDDRAKVLDFGIARMSDGSTSNLTRTGEVIGSPLFMAPEQIQGLPLTGACDIYALGVIAFTLLTGREPFRGETSTAVVLKHLHEPPPSLRELRPDLPEAWIDLLGELLVKDPKDRLQTAAELIARLGQLPAAE